MTKVMYRKVRSALVIPEADVDCFGITLQAGQIRP
jgi:hypothetical protein